MTYTCRRPSSESRRAGFALCSVWCSLAFAVYFSFAHPESSSGSSKWRSAPSPAQHHFVCQAYAWLSSFYLHFISILNFHAIINSIFIIMYSQIIFMCPLCFLRELFIINYLLKPLILISCMYYTYIYSFIIIVCNNYLFRETCFNLWSKLLSRMYIVYWFSTRYSYIQSNFIIYNTLLYTLLFTIWKDRHRHARNYLGFLKVS